MRYFLLVGYLFIHTQIVGQNLLYLQSIDDKNLYLVNLDNCSSIIVGEMPEIMYDIALSPNGQLYGVSRNRGLYKIDKNNGSGTLIKNLNVQVNALVYGPDNYLYGANIGGGIYKINPQNGDIQNLGNCGFSSGGDLTFYEGNLYLSGGGGELILVDVSQPSKSRLIGKMNASDVFGIITVGTTDCNGAKAKVYATGSNMLYEVNINNAQIKQICSLNIKSIGGAASLAEASKISRSNAGKDSSLIICVGRSTKIDLQNLIPGSEAGGKWKDMDNSNSLQNSTFNPVGLKTGDYRFRYIVGIGLCADTSLVKIAISEKIKINSIDLKNAACGKSNGEIEVRIGNASNTNLRYSIDNQNYQSSNVFKDLTSGTYVLHIRSSIGCTLDTTITLNNVGSILIDSLLTSHTSCGLPNGKIELKVSSFNTNYEYSIDGLNYTSNSVFDNLTGGNYTIHIKDSQNCKDTREIKVNTSDSLKINNTIVTSAICNIENGKVVVQVKNGTQPYRYSINNSAFVQTPLFYNLGKGEYEINVIDSKNCQANGKVNVPNDCLSRVYFPNALSPNGDGYNDSFTVFFPFNRMSIVQFTIYNRWGNVVYGKSEKFEIVSGDTLWDGTVATGIVEPGMYVIKMIVEFETGENFTFKNSIQVLNNKD